MSEPLESKASNPGDSEPQSPATFSLSALGLKPVLQAEWLAEHPEAVPYRVSQVHRGALTLLGEAGARTVAPPKHEEGAENAVGDWVLLQDDVVVKTLNRNTWIRRRAISTSKAQLIAANIDVVFVVCAFAETTKLQSRNLNTRRIDRYLHAVNEGGALPVVVINKADLGEDVSTALADLSRALNHPHVVAASAERGDVSVLKAWISAGDTVALVGPSGVGKSSLINRLVGHDALEVGDVRGADNKGKHTTTHRELVPLPGGGLLIDTPGMRQFAIYSDEQSQSSAFTDVEELATQCRFSDCSHADQPGCAVAAAVTSGALSPERLDSYQTLKREALRLNARTDAYSRHLQNKKYREFGRMVKRAQKQKRR